MDHAARARRREEWTSLPLPEDGTYVIDSMLAPLEVRDGIGRHGRSGRSLHQWHP